MKEGVRFIVNANYKPKTSKNLSFMRSYDSEVASSNITYVMYTLYSILIIIRAPLLVPVVLPLHHLHVRIPIPPLQALGGSGIPKFFRSLSRLSQM